MTKMIISNDKGFKKNKYNIVLLYKLGNITDYINIFFLWNNHWDNPPSVADKHLYMPIHLLHHNVYFFKLYIISMA